MVDTLTATVSVPSTGSQFNDGVREVALRLSELSKASSMDDLNARTSIVNDLVDALKSANPDFNFALPESGIVVRPDNVDRVLFAPTDKVKRDFKALIATGRAQRKG